MVTVLIVAAVLAWPSRTWPYALRSAVPRTVAETWLRCRTTVSARRGREDTGDVAADRLEVLALCLRSGMPAPRACGLVQTLDGGPAVGTGDLGGFVGVASALSEELGTSLAEAVQTSVEVERRRAAARRRLAVALAGPRTSMWLLTLLPVLGPLGAAISGVDLVGTYVRSLPGALACGTGLVLTAAGWWTSMRIIAAAQVPRRWG